MAYFWYSQVTEYYRVAFAIEAFSGFTRMILSAVISTWICCYLQSCEGKLKSGKYSGVCIVLTTALQREQVASTMKRRLV